MITTNLVFKRNAKPGKRLRFSNYCLTCSDPIPPNKDFCSEGCEYNFYDNSQMERNLDEALAEQREIEDDERWEKQTKCLP